MKTIHEKRGEFSFYLLLEILLDTLITTTEEKHSILCEFVTQNFEEDGYEYECIMNLIDKYKNVMEKEQEALKAFPNLNQPDHTQNRLNPIILAEAFEKHAPPLSIFEKFNFWSTPTNPAKKMAEKLRANSSWNPNEVMDYINQAIKTSENDINKCGTFYQMIETIRKDYENMQNPSSKQFVIP